jgi:hypothetical protein
MDNIISVCATQPQHVPAGRLLGKMYYGRFLDCALKRDEYTGYPHNGGEHTINLYMTPEDLSSFLSLVKETFARHDGVDDFINAVRERFAKKYPSLTLH